MITCLPCAREGTVRQAAFFLCPSPSSCSGPQGWAVCSSPVPADGLVGFLSGAGNATQWAGDYRWMNAAVSGATRIADGFNLTGSALRIVWPVIERAGAPAYSSALLGVSVSVGRHVQELSPS
ncbi:putative trans-sialidase [Trypanosoma rangeli]|uniref:Putative trans-sialidase n=1 Tax=Trypanosoma rangeli TaxID=5698 RepID=A0A3R7MWI9_TRYRA|nr:putative trans-sialidase [Trypanosoma rangeli]RNE96418.1 putative trans-sialidase [Trypanosoma rangeli]|eukprot:RNE96418.1 putative trans-sialidase [Trypanosoma rangeli]